MRGKDVRSKRYKSSPRLVGSERAVGTSRFNLPPHIWEVIVEWAEHEKRSTTNMVSVLLEEAVEKRLEDSQKG